MPPNLPHSTSISNREPGFSFLYEAPALKLLPATYSTPSAARQACVVSRNDSQTQARAETQKNPVPPQRPQTRRGSVSSFTMGDHEQLCVHEPFAPRGDTARVRADGMARQHCATEGRRKNRTPGRAATQYDHRREHRSGKLRRSDTEPSFPEQASERGDADYPANGKIKKTAKKCVAALKWLKTTVMARRGQYYGSLARLGFTMLFVPVTGLFMKWWLEHNSCFWTF